MDAPPIQYARTEDGVNIAMDQSVRAVCYDWAASAEAASYGQGTVNRVSFEHGIPSSWTRGNTTSMQAFG
jgi:hypothetical protein